VERDTPPPGWYLRQKPLGEVRQVVYPTLPFPLSLPSPFPFPLSFQTNKLEGRSDPVRGKFPASPYKYHPALLIHSFGACGALILAPSVLLPPLSPAVLFPPNSSPVDNHLSIIGVPTNIGRHMRDKTHTINEQAVMGTSCKQ